jgi:hypothetical protein
MSCLGCALYGTWKNAGFCCDMCKNTCGNMHGRRCTQHAPPNMKTSNFSARDAFTSAPHPEVKQMEQPMAQHLELFQASSEEQNIHLEQLLKQMVLMSEKLDTMRARTVQCSTHSVQHTCSAVQHTCNAAAHMQRNAVKHSAMQHTCSAAHIQCNTHEVNHIAIQCSTLPHRMDFMQCNSTHEMHCSASQCNATHMQCNTHTHIATHMQCNTVHCSAAYCPAGWTSMKAPVQVCVVMWPTRLLSTMIVMVVMAHACGWSEGPKPATTINNHQT